MNVVCSIYLTRKLQNFAQTLGHLEYRNFTRSLTLKMATSSMNLTPRIVAQKGKKHTATVILLHGSGGTGDGLRQTFRSLLYEELTFPHIRFVYPTAPVRPYSLAGGLPSNVWFDRKTLGLQAEEQLDSIEAMATQLRQLINAEVEAGIPLDRIILGGFSMGGAMALHLGYHFYPQVAGVLAISSFLENNSSVYKALEKRDKDAGLPPLLQYHGEEDDLVYYDWSKKTFSRLQTLGVTGHFVSLPLLGHSLNKHIAQSVRQWIAKTLPEEL